MIVWLMMALHQLKQSCGVSISSSSFTVWGMTMLKQNFSYPVNVSALDVCCLVSQKGNPSRCSQSGLRGGTKSEIESTSSVLKDQKERFLVGQYKMHIFKESNLFYNNNNDNNGWLLYSANLPVKTTQCASTHHSRKYTHRYRHN